MKQESPGVNCDNILEILDQAHSSVERAGMLGGVKMRLVKTDDDLRMRGEALKAEIQKDKAAGLIPFFVNWQLLMKIHVL